MLTLPDEDILEWKAFSWHTLLHVFTSVQKQGQSHHPY